MTNLMGLAALVVAERARTCAEVKEGWNIDADPGMRSSSPGRPGRRALVVAVRASWTGGGVPRWSGGVPVLWSYELDQGPVPGFADTSEGAQSPLHSRINATGHGIFEPANPTPADCA
jgi:hypothetical protein